MIIGTKNKFQDINKCFDSNFSFQNIGENVSNLFKTFSYKDVESYFSTMISLDSVNIRYLYSIFYLPSDIVKNNIEKIVLKLNLGFLEQIYPFINNENYKYIFISFLKYRFKSVNYSMEELKELKKIVFYYPISDNDLYYFNRNPNTSHLLSFYQDILTDIQDSICIIINNLIKKVLIFNSKDSSEIFYVALSFTKLLKEDYIKYVEKSFIDILTKEYQDDDRYYLKSSALLRLSGNFFSSLNDESISQLRKFINNFDETKKQNIELFTKIFRTVINKTDNMNDLNINKCLSLSCLSFYDFNFLLTLLEKKNVDTMQTKKTYIEASINSEFVIEYDQYGRRSKYIEFCFNEITKYPDIYKSEIKKIINKLNNNYDILYKNSPISLSSNEKITKLNYHKDSNHGKVIIAMYIVGILTKIHTDDIQSFINNILLKSKNYLLIETIGSNLTKDIDFIDDKKEILNKIERFINQTDFKDIDEVRAYSTLLSINKHEHIIHKLLEKNDIDLNNNLYRIMSRGLVF